MLAFLMCTGQSALARGLTGHMRVCNPCACQFLLFLLMENGLRPHACMGSFGGSSQVASCPKATMQAFAAYSGALQASSPRMVLAAAPKKGCYPGRCLLCAEPMR